MGEIGSAAVLCGDATVAFGRDLRVLAWNEAAERLTGRGAAEVLDQPCWDVLRGVDASGGLVCHPGCSIAQSCLDHRTVRATSMLVRTRDGRRRVDFSTASIACAGEEIFVHVMYEPGVGPAVMPSEAVLLTDRQREVLALLGEGLDTRAMAARLSLSRATVRNHVRAILIRLGCHSRLEAVAKGRRTGLI